MLILNNGDKLRGNASIVDVIDYTVHGLVGDVLSRFADGQLPVAESDLYPATNTVVITSIVLVNTDIVSRTVNLYIQPNGEPSRHIITKDLNLNAGASLHYDGIKVDIIGQINDGRYYTESEIDTISGSLSAEIDFDISTHSSSGDHDDRYYTETEIDSFDYATNTDLTTISGLVDTNTSDIADNTTLIATTSGTLQTNIDGKSDTGHSHTESDISDLDKYTQVEVDGLITTVSGKLDDHNEMNNLDYASSGHIGFASSDTLSMASATELTLVSGTVIRTQTLHRVDTEGNDVTDDLDTILGGTDGDIIIVRAENGTRTVTLKDGTGNLKLGGRDLELLDTNMAVMLFYSEILSQWLLIGDGGGSATAAVSDDAFSSAWDGGTAVAPSRNAVYDIMVTKSDTSHLHDDRYYTEVEVNDLLTTLSGVIDLAVAATRICNTTGATLTKGTAVTICGMSEALCCVCKSDNREFTKMPTCGVVDTDVANGAEGNMIRIGKIDLDTSGMVGNEGERIYVQGDGSIDTIIPTSGGVQRVGFLIVKAEAGTVCICIRGRKSIYAAKDEHPILRMGNDAGHQKIVFKTYTNDEIMVVDNNGNLTLSGTVDEVDIAAFKSDYDSHEHDDRYYTETELNNGQLDDRYYTESEIDTISGSLQTNIDGKSDIGHIHDDRYYTETEVDDLITTISGKLDDHDELNNLDYASSGHTGFQPAGDYLTDTEFTTYSGTLQTQIDDKSDTSHLHDDRYYTEIEVDTISGSLQTNINSKAGVLVDLNDTPSSYDTGKYLRSTVSGTEWATASGTGTSDVQTFLDLTDTPTTYSGYAGRYLKVSLDESELEYASIQGTATTTISGWDVYDATTYYGDFEHNLSTEELSVFIVDAATNKEIGVEDIEIISENTVRIYVIEDTLALKINIITGGIGTGTGVGTSTVGLVDDAWVQIDDTGAADNDYAKFTTSGIEGRNYSEVLGDLSGQASTTFSFNDKGLQRANLLDCGIVTNEIGLIGGGSQTIDIESGNSVSATVDTAETTFTFNNPTVSGMLCAFSLVLTNGGSQTINWPTSADWEDGTAPTLTASGVDILVFSTIDGGTVWHGSTFSLDSK